jgi:hypothetical protein
MSLSSFEFPESGRQGVPGCVARCRLCGASTTMIAPPMRQAKEIEAVRARFVAEHQCTDRVNAFRAEQRAQQQ